MLKIKESARSEELRAELRKQGYRFYWDVTENTTRVSYWNNGAGKSLLILEHAEGRQNIDPDDYRWTSWDIYRQLTSDNHIAATYQALEEFTSP